jgi:hypothetical protein
MEKKSKTVHEAFVRFFETPTRESFRDLLKEHAGELRHCDFKESWPDLADVSKHLLGLGNAGGGCIVVGVKENEDKTLTPVGIAALKDKAEISSKIKQFVPPALMSAMEVGDYSYDSSEYGTLNGKRFQVIFIHPRPDAVPFVSLKDGAKIRANAIYVHREGETEEAKYEEVQALIKQRLDSLPQTVQARDLKEHLEELKVLYGEIPRNIFTGGPVVGRALAAIAADLGSVFRGSTERNPLYPEEDYQAFVRRILDDKRRLIEKLVGVKP